MEREGKQRYLFGSFAPLHFYLIGDFIMVSMDRMRKIRSVLSKGIYGKPYTKLSEKQAINIGKKTANVIKKESKRKSKR